MPLYDRDAQPCSIDIMDSDENLLVRSPKWGVKKPKILAFQTVALLRYLSYKIGTLEWKIRIEIAVSFIEYFAIIQQWRF